MDKQRWTKIRSLFESALEYNADERDEYLRKACGDDDNLYEEVKSLLAADAAPHDLFGGKAIEAVDLSDLSLEGERVGAYQIRERIGIGGMGAVYIADRADGQFEQTVALKLIKRGMDTEAILRRFHDERQILARLDHPNIARLLDGGLTDDGLPYFTMEYVDGDPIDRYCDNNRLSINERLGLFLTAVAAVQYAHRNLVVHRDLKPSNILVATDGTVKLLDFGIAKMLDADDDELTRTGARLMTPAYASPEQMAGRPVTTATDVYSLGAVLYELLSGRRPLDAAELTPQEFERAVRTTEPEKPSRAIERRTSGGKSPVTAQAIAHARRSHPSQVRRRLTGDLDNICMVALRKEPERRYSSVGHLADDIRRHLSGRPVTARRDTVGYRFRKFLWRNRVAVGVSAAVVIVIATLVTFGTARLARERNRAMLEAEKAEQVSRFLASLFEAANPDQARGKEVTARDMLDRGAERLQEELTDQPEVRAKMMSVVAEVYLSLGYYDEADSLVRDALAIQRELNGERHIDTMKSMQTLCLVVWEKGDYETSMKMVKELLEIRRDVLGPDHLDVALSLNDLGWMFYEKDSLDTAEELEREALGIRRRAGDERAISESLTNLAIVVMSKGDLEAAEQGFREALEIRRRLGENPSDVAFSLNNLATVLEQKGDYEAGEPVYREALDLYTRLFGLNHPDLATPYVNLARLLRKTNKNAEAESLLQLAVALDQQRGEDHPYVAYDLNELGRVCRRLGKLDEAEAAYREAIRIYRVGSGTGPTAVASPLVGLGTVLTERGDPEGGEPLIREGLRLWTEVLGENHIKTASAEAALGACLSAMNRFEEAEAILLECYERPQGGPRDDIAYTAQNLVDLYERWGKPSQAAAYRSAAESGS
jgi:serine/threonine protein kinase/tetratricopeptide (TPR) repeat protein